MRRPMQGGISTRYLCARKPRGMPSHGTTGYDDLACLPSQDPMYVGTRGAVCKFETVFERRILSFDEQVAGRSGLESSSVVAQSVHHPPEDVQRVARAHGRESIGTGSPSRPSEFVRDQRSTNSTIGAGSSSPETWPTPGLPINSHVPPSFR